MKEVADNIGINPITLSQSLNGNPTLSRLTEVAETLGVSVSELFSDYKEEVEVCGFIKVNGTIREIQKKEDVEDVLKEIEKLEKTSL